MGYGLKFLSLCHFPILLLLPLLRFGFLYLPCSAFSRSLSSALCTALDLRAIAFGSFPVSGSGVFAACPCRFQHDPVGVLGEDRRGASVASLPCSDTTLNRERSGKSVLKVGSDFKLRHYQLFRPVGRPLQSQGRLWMRSRTMFRALF